METALMTIHYWNLRMNSVKCGYRVKAAIAAVTEHSIMRQLRKRTAGLAG